MPPMSPVGPGAFDQRHLVPPSAARPDVDAAAEDGHVAPSAEPSMSAESMPEVAASNTAAIAAVAVDRLNEALALLDRVRAAVPRASHQIEAAIQSAIAMLQTQRNDGIALDSTVSKLRLSVQSGTLPQTAATTLAANDHAARAYTSLDVSAPRSRVPSSLPR